MDRAELKPTGQTVDLREMTDARVALGRFGSGLPTKASLTFALDHARAREAVWTRMDCESIQKKLSKFGLKVIQVDSAAGNRSDYIRRPDLGRRLSSHSVQALQTLHPDAYDADIAIVIGDGLSSTAVEINCIPLISQLVPRFNEIGFSLAPIILASQARVAIADPIGETLRVGLTIILLGERPGLSTADSLGAYMTYKPGTGTPDSRRNCISNIRQGGLVLHKAVESISALACEILTTCQSGVRQPEQLGAPPRPISRMINGLEWCLEADAICNSNGWVQG